MRCSLVSYRRLGIGGRTMYAIGDKVTITVPSTDCDPMPGEITHIVPKDPFDVGQCYRVSILGTSFNVPAWDTDLHSAERWFIIS